MHSKKYMTIPGYILCTTSYVYSYVYVNMRFIPNVGDTSRVQRALTGILKRLLQSPVDKLRLLTCTTIPTGWLLAEQVGLKELISGKDVLNRFLINIRSFFLTLDRYCR